MNEEKIYDWGLFLMGVLSTIVITILILGLCGSFNIPMDKLDIDKNELAKSHVIQYYPEYKDCRFEYKSPQNIGCGDYISGVKIYCSDTENKDGMNVLKDDPSLTLCFDDITLDEILDNILIKEGLLK